MSWHISRAMMQDYENSHSLRVEDAGCSVASCLVGAPSALSKSNQTPLAYLCSDRMTAFSNLSRYGITFAPLTADRGAAVLMWYLRDGLVKTSAPEETEKDWTERDQDSGAKWSGSFVKYDLDGRSWKTHQCSLLGGWEEFSGTWPRWGMMRGGECWEEGISVHGIFVKESGWWLPTIPKLEGKGVASKRFRGSPAYRGTNMCEGLRTCKEDPAYLTPSFGEYAMGVPDMWTDLAPLGMDKYRQWLNSHGKH